LAILLALRWAPARLRAPGSRFRVAVGASVATWIASLVVVQWDWSDAIGGGLLLMAGLTGLFIAWSVLVWGFTLNLLLGIARHDGPVTLDRWIEGYLGAAGEERLARDRLALLERRGIVAIARDKVTITPGKGRLAVRLMTLGTWFFGPQPS